MTQFEFQLSAEPLQVAQWQMHLTHPAAGAYVAFEGWVRNHNAGRQVVRLEYEAFTTLACKEGQRILMRVAQRHEILRAVCVHRVGSLAVGELAVWVGVSTVHRTEAFAACHAIIDAIKLHVPIWKKEYYAEGDADWVHCAHCNTAARLQDC